MPTGVAIVRAPGFSAKPSHDNSFPLTLRRAVAGAGTVAAAGSDEVWVAALARAGSNDGPNEMSGSRFPRATPDTGVDDPPRSRRVAADGFFLVVPVSFGDTTPPEEVTVDGRGGFTRAGLA
jgi:hypothetical protein